MVSHHNSCYSYQHSHFHTLHLYSRSDFTAYGTLSYHANATHWPQKFAEQTQIYAENSFFRIVLRQVRVIPRSVRSTGIRVFGTMLSPGHFRRKISVD